MTLVVLGLAVCGPLNQCIIFMLTFFCLKFMLTFLLTFFGLTRGPATQKMLTKNVNIKMMHWFYGPQTANPNTTDITTKINVLFKK